MNKIVRVVTITMLGLESLILPIALLGMLPTDSTNPDNVEKYWLWAAGIGLVMIVLGGWWLKRHKANI